MAKRNRRTTEQLINDLEAKIQSIKARAERQKVKADPALRHTAAALRSVDKALAAVQDNAAKKALAEARAIISACLALHGATPSNGVLTPRGRRSAGVEPEVLLSYVKNYPGQRGEAIAEALGTETKVVRPVMKRLIADGQVKTRGQKRGMTYSAA
jgi:hypothetical protein